MTVLNTSELSVQQSADKLSPAGVQSPDMGERLPSWVDKVRQAAESDNRAQPWKKTLGDTHDKGAEGEDLINLNLPNFVQCGSLAA